MALVSQCLSVGGGQSGEVSSSRLLHGGLVHRHDGSVGVSDEGGNSGHGGYCGHGSVGRVDSSRSCGVVIGGQGGGSVGNGALRGEN